MQYRYYALNGTRFKRACRDLSAYPYALLKHPKPKNKLGRLVTKGKFKGYKVFSLTLEERATCPTSCERWGDCYGNNMPFAHRLQETCWRSASPMCQVSGRCTCPVTCVRGFLFAGICEAMGWTTGNKSQPCNLGLYSPQRLRLCNSSRDP